MRQDTRMEPASQRVSKPWQSPPPRPHPPTPSPCARSATPTPICGRCEGIELEVPAHSVLGLVGPSGCGKSTLLELICGLREPSEGTIAMGGATRRRSASPAAPSCPSATCSCPGTRRSTTPPWPCEPGHGPRGGARRSGRRSSSVRARRIRGLRPAELSGGMRQRVALLRTLIAGKPMLALDEPFASLDAITRAEMQEWLAGALRDDPRTVVLVTHDVEEALYLSDRVAVLSPARPHRRPNSPPRAAGRRPRRRRHRPRLRRRPRGSPPRAARKSWLMHECERNHAIARCCSGFAARRRCSVSGSWPARPGRSPTRSTSRASSSLAGGSRRARCGRTASCSPKTPG